jgi:hypothetical protein
MEIGDNILLPLTLSIRCRALKIKTNCGNITLAFYDKDNNDTSKTHVGTLCFSFGKFRYEILSSDSNNSLNVMKIRGDTNVHAEGLDDGMMSNYWVIHTRKHTQKHTEVHTRTHTYTHTHTQTPRHPDTQSLKYVCTERQT